MNLDRADDDDDDVTEVCVLYSLSVCVSGVQLSSVTLSLLGLCHMQMKPQQTHGVQL